MRQKYDVLLEYGPLTTTLNWWAQQDSNLRPADYESDALTRLSYGPEIGVLVRHLGVDILAYYRAPTPCASEPGRRTILGPLETDSVQQICQKTGVAATVAGRCLVDHFF